MMRLTVSTAALLGMFGVGVFVWKKAPLELSQAQATAVPAVATVEQRDIRLSVKASGEIGPAEQVSVRPEINGRIVQFEVDVGDKVRKGDLLFTLDDADLQIERASRLTEIDVAKLQIERTQRDHERNQQLFGEKLISKEVFDNSKTDYSLAKKNLERAEAALRLVDDRLSKTKIVAPFDCSVLTRPVSVGQAVSGAAGFNSGTEVLTVANLQEMVAMVHINQTDIPRVSVGQEVNVEVESVRGLAMKGFVERVAPQATLKNGLRGYPFQIIGMFRHYQSDVDRRAKELAAASRTQPADGPNRNMGRGSPAGSSGIFASKNNTIFIPVNTLWIKFRASLGTNNTPDPRVNRIYFRVRDLERFGDALQQARNVLLLTHRGIEDFIFNTQENWTDTIARSIRNARLSGGLIAGIGLLIGGMGIMNIMLASITERIREIGVRKAVGGSNESIFLQILTESVLIAGLGGALGLGAAFGLLKLLSLISPSENIPIVTSGAMGAALAFSVAVGIGAGLWPALKAARLDPIQALRYE